MTELQDSMKPVFIMRPKGMDLETFKKVCIERFREAGMLAGAVRPERPSPGPAAGRVEDDES